MQCSLVSNVTHHGPVHGPRDHSSYHVLQVPLRLWCFSLSAQRLLISLDEGVRFLLNLGCNGLSVSHGPGLNPGKLPPSLRGIRGIDREEKIIGDVSISGLGRLEKSRLDS